MDVILACLAFFWRSRMLLLGGALLVLEKILNDTKDGPLVTLIYDLGMLISAGGRERTGVEYAQLLAKYGFVDIEIKLMSNAHSRDAILARKPPAPEALPEANDWSILVAGPTFKTQPNVIHMKQL